MSYIAKLDMALTLSTTSSHVCYPDASSLPQAALSETACIAMPHQDTALLLHNLQWRLEQIKAAAAAKSQKILWAGSVSLHASIAVVKRITTMSTAQQ